MTATVACQVLTRHIPAGGMATAQGPAEAALLAPALRLTLRARVVAFEGSGLRAVLLLRHSAARGWVPAGEFTVVQGAALDVPLDDPAMDPDRLEVSVRVAGSGVGATIDVALWAETTDSN